MGDDMRKLCVLVGICLLLASCMPCYAELSVSAVSALVVDADTGDVFYEKNADQRSLIASTTKIMTGLLACELCDLDAELPVPPDAVGVEGSSIYLQAGETVTVRTLLYGTLLQSGNDAATALAIAACGDVAAFVEHMNEKARVLGLSATHFANPHGLDSDENYSTARDLAKLACAALQNEAFAAAVATKTETVGGRCFVNHNKLLWRLEGACGVKTGFTKAAGRILVSAVKRGGRTLVAVTIHAPDDWNDHAKLYEAALAHYVETPLAVRGEPVCTVPTAAGAMCSVELLAADDLSMLLLPDEAAEYRYCGASILFPPFLYGHDAGYVHVYVRGRKIADLPVVFGASLPSGGTSRAPSSTAMSF